MTTLRRIQNLANEISHLAHEADETAPAAMPHIVIPAELHSDLVLVLEQAAERLTDFAKDPEHFTALRAAIRDVAIELPRNLRIAALLELLSLYS